LKASELGKALFLSSAEAVCGVRVFDYAPVNAGHSVGYVGSSERPDINGQLIGEYAFGTGQGWPGGGSATFNGQAISGAYWVTSAPKNGLGIIQVNLVSAGRTLHTLGSGPYSYS